MIERNISVPSKNINQKAIFNSHPDLINLTYPKNIALAMKLMQKTFDNCEVYLVGGCIRNMLLNLSIKDYDLTTNLTPEEIKYVFRDYPQINNNGEKHGTVSVLFNGEVIEITTYRTEANYLDNRHPKTILFTKSLREDLSRRDFTINALCYGNDFKLIDMFNGREDLNNKIIRCIGNPESRFEEDALRILRAMRFASQLDFTIEFDTLLAMKKLKSNLKNISVERIREELNGIITGKAFMRVASQCSDILVEIIPELKPCLNFDHKSPYHFLDVYEHILAVTQACKDTNYLVKLACLLHDIGKPLCFTEIENDTNIRRSYKGHAIYSEIIAKNILQRLKYSNADVDKICFLIKYHDLTFDLNNPSKTIRRFLNKFQSDWDLKETFEAFLSLREADRKCHSYASDPKFIKIEDLRQNFTLILENRLAFCLKDLDINGYDIINLGIKPGPQVGKLLTILLEKVINEEIPNKKDDLINCIITTTINLKGDE